MSHSTNLLHIPFSGHSIVKESSKVNTHRYPINTLYTWRGSQSWVLEGGASSRIE